MKCSLGISNFIEEISSLSCSIVFLYFFALIYIIYVIYMIYTYIRHLKSCCENEGAISSVVVITGGQVSGAE